MVLIPASGLAFGFEAVLAWCHSDQVHGHVTGRPRWQGFSGCLSAPKDSRPRAPAPRAAMHWAILVRVPAAQSVAMRAARSLATGGDDVGFSLAQAIDPRPRRPSTQAAKAAANRSPSCAFIMSSRASCAAMPRANGRISCKNHSLFNPQTRPFTKSPAPESVAHRIKSMISGKGYRTLPAGAGHQGLKNGPEAMAAASGNLIIAMPRVNHGSCLKEIHITFRRLPRGGGTMLAQDVAAC